MLRTNVRGTLVVAQQVARRVRPGGAIVSFSSSVVARPAGAPRHPEDIANAVAFLTGPDGRWVNGQILFANGGIA